VEEEGRVKSGGKNRRIYRISKNGNCRGEKYREEALNNRGEASPKGRMFKEKRGCLAKIKQNAKKKKDLKQRHAFKWRQKGGRIENSC